MVQQESVFSKQYISQQLIQTLGEALSESELSNCLQQIKFLEPTVGKQFWQALDTAAGIYIILAGKVRLIGSDDNLIASREASDSFGELTLFPEGDFQPYAARASVGLKLCYLPQECLQDLFRQYPNIRDRLYHQAVVWDLLLLSRQTLP
jgi:ATP-binding cassette subfamily B protein